MDHWWNNLDRYRGWIHFSSGISPIICGIYPHRNRSGGGDNLLNFKRKRIKVAQLPRYYDQGKILDRALE